MNNFAKFEAVITRTAGNKYTEGIQRTAYVEIPKITGKYAKQSMEFEAFSIIQRANKGYTLELKDLKRVGRFSFESEDIEEDVWEDEVEIVEELEESVENVEVNV